MSTIHSSQNTNLLLLLAATPIGIGCVIVTDDGDDTTGADTGTPQTTSGSETGGSTDSTPVTSDGTGTSDGSSGGSSGADSTGADSTGADSTGGSGADVCPAYADHAIKCMVPYSEYTLDACTYQQMSVETYYPECSILWEEYIACLSTLSCEDLQGVMRCPDEEAALLEMSCPTIE